MSEPPNHNYRADIPQSVAMALAEDIGEQDITAQLIPASQLAKATIITRQAAVICGREWVDEVFKQVNASININWLVEDGNLVEPDTILCTLEGNARSLLTGERTALNYLQLLSGTATVCAEYAKLIADTGAKLLDTRKTIPGLRSAQKYAVTQGGCHNHRMGLYDAFLIKENHIAACGSVQQAVHTARQQVPDKLIEVEVENLTELTQALAADADIIMLDNFSLDMMQQAVAQTGGQAKLEASGGISKQTLRDIANTGVDYISIGALTKDCKAIDLSMRMLKE